MIMRPAASADLTAIERLLAEAQLPTSGVEDHLATFVVVEVRADGFMADAGNLPCRSNLAAVGGLEIHGRLALLRSLAVGTEHRQQGIASMICDRLEKDAVGRGISRVYLLTETAESFFSTRGYAVAAREDAPPEITATEEFTTLCPDSAVLMVRTC
jgi:amino-acid N-acetyltransferase